MEVQTTVNQGKLNQQNPVSQSLPTPLPQFTSCFRLYLTTDGQPFYLSFPPSHPASEQVTKPAPSVPVSQSWSSLNVKPKPVPAWCQSRVSRHSSRSPSNTPTASTSPSTPSAPSAPSVPSIPSTPSPSTPYISSIPTPSPTSISPLSSSTSRNPSSTQVPSYMKSYTNRLDFMRTLHRLIRKHNARNAWRSFCRTCACPLSRGPCARAILRFCETMGGELEALSKDEGFKNVGSRTTCRCTVRNTFKNEISLHNL